MMVRLLTVINSNHSSHDFSMFLVGKPIPSHITSLPETVLNTPFGQMLRPQLDAAMRTVTQAPVPTPQQVTPSVASAVASQTKASQEQTAVYKGALSKYLGLAKVGHKPVLYSVIPPLDKMAAKLDEHGKVPIVASLSTWIRSSLSPDVPKQESPLPDLPSFADWLRKCRGELPPEKLFAAYDFLRIALAEPRVSGWFLADGCATLVELLTDPAAHTNCPFALSLISLQLSCNLFSSPLSHSLFLEHEEDSKDTANNQRKILLTKIIDLASYHLLLPSPAGFSAAETPRAYSAAVALLYNLSIAHQRAVASDSQGLSADQQIELTAGLIEAIDLSDSLLSTEVKEAERRKLEADAKVSLQRQILSLAFIIVEEHDQSELRDLCRAMDAKGVIEKKSKSFTGQTWLKDTLVIVR